MGAKPSLGPGPKRILYVVDQMSQCAWYRCSVPGAELAKMGHDVGLTEDLSDPNLSYADIIVFLRHYSARALQAMRAAKAAHKLVVYDIDDALWNLDPTNPVYPFYSQPEIRKGIEACIRAAHVVSTTSEPLAKRLRGLNKCVSVLPNMLPAEVWPFLGAKPQSDDYVIVGWAGDPSHYADLEIVRDVVADVLDAYPDVWMVCAGIDPTPFAPHPRLALPPRVPIEDYSELVYTFDIGIAPLVDTEFNRSKSDLKVLEYSMVGIPVVASDVEAYRGFVKDGETGLLVKTAEQWRDALGKLIEDRSLREEMGGRGNARARERLIGRTAGMWLEAYGLPLPGSLSAVPPVSPEKPASPKGRGALAPAPRRQRKAVSIVLLTFKKLALTQTCIERIRENTDDYEIVIIDNASEDGSRDWLRALGESSDDVTVVLNDTNEGFAAGCNRGFREAHHELVCLLNNDTEPLPGWLDAMRDAFVDGVGAVGAKLLFPDGTIQHAGIEFVEANAPTVTMLPNHRFLRAPADLPAANVLEAVPGVTAACLLTSKSVWEEVGGIDEGYVIANFEDVDFNLRIRDAGLSVVYQPAAVVIHHEHGSWDVDSDAGTHAHFTPNLERLVGIWNERLLGGLARVGVYAVGRHVLEGSVAGEVDVGIVIPVMDNSAMTKACIERVLETKGDLEIDIVVVDNGSSDDTPEILGAFGDSVRTISNAENRGFTVASNQGARAARGRHIVFLNNDTLPEPGWLEWLVHTADKQQDVGAVGSKLVYPDGTLQEAGGIIFSDGSGCNYGRGDDPNHPRYRYVREVDYCSAASLLVKRDVFDRLGGFDERYAPAYYEDTDLCFGVRSLGLKVIYQPKSVVVHLEGRTAGTDTSSGLKHYQEVNKPKFVEKWREELVRQYEPDGASIERACARGMTEDIFLVHPTLLAYDVSAGDLRFYRLAMILRGLGVRLTLCATSSTQADREKYLEDLEQMGIEVYASDPRRGGRSDGEWYDPYPLDLQRLLGLRRFEAAILSHFNTAMPYLDDLRALAPDTQVIVDSCDIHYLREMRKAEVEGDQEHLGRAMRVREMELATYARSDLVLTVTEDEKQVLLKELPDLIVEVVPLVHDSVAQTPPFEARSGLLFVGYFVHAPNQDAMWFFVNDVFPLVRERLSGVKLYIVGGEPTPEVLAMAADDIEVTGFVPETEPYLNRCRVSIAPLRYGAGMKGKIGEAMMNGIPVVTTTIGAEGIGLENDVNALIVDSAEDFAEQVVRLYNDQGLWNSIVGNAKRHIDENYSTHVVSEKIAGLLGLEAKSAETMDACS